MLTIRHIHDGHVAAVERAGLDDALRAPGYVWIDLTEPSADEVSILDDPEVALDPMIVEDFVQDRHLPKVEAVGDWLSLTVHGIRVEQASVEIDTIELDVAMREGLLITYHAEKVTSVHAVADRIDTRGAPTYDRPVLLLHLLLDVMNDVFVPFVDLMERRLDVIEEDILTEPTEDTRREIYALQRDVIQLRRVVVPQAEALRRLGRDRPILVTADDQALFRDIYDHLYRMAELSESYRQLLDSAMQSYRSSLDDDLNEMLTTLTIVSALLLPISVVAGIYGTNFDYIPELSLRYGYFGMWGVFVLIVTGMLLWFRRRGWVGKRAERAARERRRAMHDVLEIPVLGSVLKVPYHGARAVASTGKTVAGLPIRAARRMRNGNGDPDRGDGG